MQPRRPLLAGVAILLVMSLGLPARSSATDAGTPSAQPSVTPSETPVPSADPTPTMLPSPTPIVPNSPAASPTPRPTVSETPMASPSPSPTPSASPTPTASPTLSPIPSPIPSPTPSPTPSPAPTPVAASPAGGIGLLGSAVEKRVAFEFRLTPYRIRPLESWQLPYYSTAIVPLQDSQPHDAEGVRMFMLNGVMYDHPVNQAQYAIALINSYNASGDTRYLDRARAQADRLIERAVASRGAIYFPYPFAWSRGSGDAMQPPWYSGMAQGQALTVFVRLFELTSDDRYADAATLTFNSFTNLKSSSAPWVTLVDGDGYVWVDEYPKKVPDWTYNGFNFAIYGIHDYFRLTGSPGALRLLRGAITTSHVRFADFRNPGWISRYCLTHDVLNWRYHFTHLGQMEKLYTITGRRAFARHADQLFVDYADPRMAGTVRFARGTHTAYRFDSAGNLTATKRYTLSRASSAAAGSRETIRGRPGAWLGITNGVFAGWWVREQPGVAYIAGMLARTVRYDPPRTVTFAAGSYVGYRFDAAGMVTGRRSGTLSRTSSARTSLRSIINGGTYLQIVDGMWAGYWIRLAEGITY